MYHFMIDGFKGFRSRFDEIHLVQEIVDEVPLKLGLQPAMPAFLIPYYNGVVAEDCGISSFAFLSGGHITLHTFSYRETYFADVLSYKPFDEKKLRLMFESALPCAVTTVYNSDRANNISLEKKINKNADFGPHLLIEINDYKGPETMGELFSVFDKLPGHIGMTPIMRPYVTSSLSPSEGKVTSIMTMIAESHISLHIFHKINSAYLDLFSCSFFEYEPVMFKLKEIFPGKYESEVLISRGKLYKELRNEGEVELSHRRTWLKSLS